MNLTRTLITLGAMAATGTIAAVIKAQRQEGGRRIVTTRCDVTFTAARDERLPAVTAWASEANCPECLAIRASARRYTLNTGTLT